MRIRDLCTRVTSPTHLYPRTASTKLLKMEEKYYGINNSEISKTGTTDASSVTATLIASRLRRKEQRAREKVKPRSRYQVRRLKSRGALQVLLWNLLVFSHQDTAYFNLLRFFDLNQPWKYILAAVFLLEVLPNLFYPVAGWIADAKVGRYKVIRLSLFLMWLGSVILLLISLLKYSVAYSPDMIKDNVNSRYRTIFTITLLFAILVYLLNSVGIAGFHANIIPFGLDQMEDGSTEQHSAFIHWYYWTRNFSFGVLIRLIIHTNSNYCSHAFSFHPVKNPEPYDLETLLRLDFGALVCDCAFLSAALCIDFLFSPKYLNKDPKTHYPLRRIWRISKFVRENKQLVGRRKAITFTYDAPPTRWDFAKRLYGGPFDGDDVEDVHTFWRILGFIFSVGLGGIFIVYQGYSLYGPFIKHMQLPTIFSECISEFAISNLTPNATIVVVIPIYEFIIYPFFRRYVLRILRRIGLGMTLALIGTIGILLMDIFGHIHGGEHCMLFKGNFDALPFKAISFIPFIFVISLGELFVFIPTFEFICAQSPYSMRGLLIGLFYATEALFISLIGLIFGMIVAVFNNHRNALLSNLSCGSWYLSFSIGIGIIGFILYVIAAKCYKKRERDGHQINEQTVIEGYYEPKDDKTLSTNNNKSKVDSVLLY